MCFGLKVISKMHQTTTPCSYWLGRNRIRSSLKMRAMLNPPPIRKALKPKP